MSPSSVGPGSVLITGASRRIGSAIARDFASRGFDLHLHANTSVTELGQLAESLESEFGVKVTRHIADLSDLGAVQRLVAALRNPGPVPTVVINNASIFEENYQSAATADIELVVKILTVNTAVPLVLSALLADLDGGQVINITDGHVDLTCAMHLPYDVSKAALADATRRLAVLLAPKVRVNAVAPGLVLPPPGRDQSHLERMALRAPLQRPSQLAHIIAAIRFLCDVDTVTGEIIMVDGGEHLVWDSESSERTVG